MAGTDGDPGGGDGAGGVPPAPEVQASSATPEAGPQAPAAEAPVDGAKPKAKASTTDKLTWVLGLGSIALMLSAVILIWALWPESNEQQEACYVGVAGLVKQAEQPITVELHASTQPPRVVKAADEISRQLVALASQSDGKLVFQRIDVVGDAQRFHAASLGLQEAVLTEDPANPEPTQHKGYFGVVLTQAGKNAVIPILDPAQSHAFAFWFSNKLRELTAKTTGKHYPIATLSIPGGVSLEEESLVASDMANGPSFRGILTQAFPFFKLSEVSLAEPEPAVLAEASTLLVTQPGRDLTQSELERIDAFLMQGDRALVIIASAANISSGDASMSVTLNSHGLERLLAGYGIEMKQDLVFDPAGAVELSAAGGAAGASAPALLKITSKANAKDGRIAQGFPVFSQLQELAMPLASSLVIHKEKQPGAEASVVLRTTDGARATNISGISAYPGRPLPESLDAPAERVVGVALIGDIKSAFGDKQAKGRVLVISSSQFGVNPLVRAGKQPSPPGVLFGATPGDARLLGLSSSYGQRYLTASVLVISNVLNWTTGSKELAACNALVAPKD